LRAVRLARGESLTEAGRAIGISFQQVRQYESGANRISASMLNELAHHFGVAIEVFYPDQRDGTVQSDNACAKLALNRLGPRLATAFIALPGRQRAAVVEVIEGMARLKLKKGEI
jgi:transcriptional regulator with XRE-family HTH domain